MSMKNSNDTTGNRIRDLPACNSVPQSTAPPRGGFIWRSYSYGRTHEVDRNGAVTWTDGRTHEVDRYGAVTRTDGHMKWIDMAQLLGRTDT